MDSDDVCLGSSFSNCAELQFPRISGIVRNSLILFRVGAISSEPFLAPEKQELQQSMKDITGSSIKVEGGHLLMFTQFRKFSGAKRSGTL